MTKFKKSYFWPILGPFSQFLGQKKFFLQNLALSCSTSHEFLAPCQNKENINETIPKNAWIDERTKGWMEGWKGAQTPFFRTFPATASSPKRQPITLFHSKSYLTSIHSSIMSLKHLVKNWKDEEMTCKPTRQLYKS